MTEPATVPLRSVLEGLATQLHRMSAMGNEIEDAVGRSISRAAPGTEERGTLQKLDNLVQSLAGVAAYVDGLALAVDGDCRIDPGEAVAAVNQKSLAGALRGLMPVEVDAGSADFF